MQRIVKFIESFVEHNRGGILLILLLITVLGSVVGYRYYHYMNDSPEFCLTCHVMQTSFLDWQQSRHWNLKCQICHRMSIFEQNRLLVAYVARGRIAGPERELHGKAAPWQACLKCHSEDMGDGRRATDAYGHYRHVRMGKIGCEKCHVSGRHNFPPNGNACLGCHGGMFAGRPRLNTASCLQCHNFS